MEFRIDKNFHDVRLDKFLCRTYQSIPLSGIFRMIRKGNVKVNKKKKKQNYRLQAGDLVRVWEATPPTAPKTPIKIPENKQKEVRNLIVYEDKNILLCNKPANMVIHGGSKHAYGLTELIQASKSNPHFCFVHRIDKATSGLVLGAKNRPTARKLSALFAERKIEKYYLILVEGAYAKEVDAFTLNSFLKKETEKVIEHQDGSNGAKKASSDFFIRKRGKYRTLLRAKLHTGRSHQLRVQLANHHHPIVGDSKYGNRGLEKQMYLLAQRLVIPSLQFDFSLRAPRSYLNALYKKRESTIR